MSNEKEKKPAPPPRVSQKARPGGLTIIGPKAAKEKEK